MEDDGAGQFYSSSMANGQASIQSMNASSPLVRSMAGTQSQGYASQAAVMAMQALQRETDRMEIELKASYLRENELREKVAYLEEFWSGKLESQLISHSVLSKEKLVLEESLRKMSEQKETEINAVKCEFESTVRSLRSKNTAQSKEIEYLREKAETLNSNLENEQQKKSNESTKHAKNMEKIRIEHTKELAAVKANLANTIKELETSKAACVTYSKDKFDTISELKKKHERKMATLAVENSELRAEIRQKEFEAATAIESYRSKRKQDHEKLAEVKKKLEDERHSRAEETDNLSNQVHNAQVLLSKYESEVQRYLS